MLTPLLLLVGSFMLCAFSRCMCFNFCVLPNRPKEVILYGNYVFELDAHIYLLFYLLVQLYGNEVQPHSPL